MNPSQAPGGSNPGTASVPPRPSEASVADIPEEAFGFADKKTTLPPIRPAPANRAPVATASPMVAPQPAPVPTLVSVPTPLPEPAQVPTPPQLIVTPPAPQLPLPPAASPTPMPADVLPPQRVPPIPTLAAQPPIAASIPAAVAPVLAPAPPAEPKPAPVPVLATNPAAAEAISLTDEPFDPAKVPVSSSSTSVNPITATFTPAPVTHLPDDIAARIGETPMQNSTDIAKKIGHGTAGSRLKGIVSFLIFTAAIFIAAFLINQFIFQSYYVEGTSMTPTLQNNDRLIISKVERTLAGVQGKPYIPERGQIVVLDSSIIGLNGQKEQLIKRVVGLPGDHVHIEGGNVIITNGQHPGGFDVTKDLGLTNLKATYVDAPIDLTVPTGQVFVMGDNREQGGSYDSRAFGPIDGDKIQGRLWSRILPLDKAQLF